jgi:tetratricopeptide (TPR) repeat protein
MMARRPPPRVLAQHEVDAVSSSALTDRDQLLALARDQRDAGKLREAEAACRRLLALDDADADAHRVLGTILLAQDRGAEAVASLERAVSLDAANATAFRQLANALGTEGRAAEAIAADRRALELRPRDVWARYHLAQLKTFTTVGDDPDLDALEALAGEPDRLQGPELTAVLFALAKACDDLGDDARSFGYLERANALRRSTLDYDLAGNLSTFEQIAAVFDDELFARCAGSGSQSDLPVLIVGMPRSGTTLVEQILASHPAVSGGGELRHLQELVTGVTVLAGRGHAFPDGVLELRREDLGRLGHGYVERLRALAPEAARVTDKNPLNFRYLGFARMIVPRAAIVHCTRDPVDTCFSCYRAFFGAVNFAFDLEELGRYYRAYERLMEHWRAVLPESWILDVSYENLVSDLEGQARRLVAHCGLEWDDACLNFHAAGGNVRTASFAQVRQPIYDSSVARWRRYEQHLGPLLEALGPYAPGPAG